MFKPNNYIITVIIFISITITVIIIIVIIIIIIIIIIMLINTVITVFLEKSSGESSKQGIQGHGLPLFIMLSDEMMNKSFQRRI